MTEEEIHHRKHKKKHKKDDDGEHHHHHKHKKKKKSKRNVVEGEEDAVEDVEAQEEAFKERSPEVSLPRGLDDPLKPREGRDLVWKGINMKLKLKTKKGEQKQEKLLLDNVWGEVPKRQVTAIMSPSGSGKTSLLNILAGRARSNGTLEINADVRLNNYQVDPTDINVRKKIAFVAQDDSLAVTATPREAIQFSARLRLPRSLTDAQLENLTNKMLSELGLEACADTFVGGALLKGISGGERKRTSVGVELVTRPALVFLDEPTSGLDSFNAVQLCSLLGKVAQAGSSVLFTIHQPSSEIFNAFDQLILLNSGRVMYNGSVQGVPSHFKERGFPCPTNYNPADWIMTVALSNSIEALDKAGFFPKDDRNLGESFKAEEHQSRDELGISSRFFSVEDEPTPGLGTQLKLLFRRELKHLRRNTHALKARTAMAVMTSLLGGCIFFQVAKEEFDVFINVQSTFGALLISLMANVLATVLPSLSSLPEERPVFLREYSTNHYSVYSYFGSKLAMELGVTAVQVLVSSIISYFMVGFEANYGIFWSAIYVMACTSTALGVLVGSAVENPSVAMEFLPAIFMPQILLSGFFSPPDLIPVWLAWIRWISPLFYGVRILLAAEFGNDRCGDLDPNFCNTVLDNVGVEEDDSWWSFLVLILLFVVLRLTALVVLRRKAEKFY